MRTALFIALIFTIRISGQSLTTAPTKNALPEIQVPTPVRESFSRENPNILPVWKKEGKYYRATFIDQATNLGNAIVYESGGKAIRRERELEKTEYPPAVVDYYNRTYPGEGFVLWSRTDNGFVQTYYALRSSQVLTFDKDGRYIGPKKDSVRPEQVIRIIGSAE